MKYKRILIICLVLVLVAGFSIVSLGAGKNNDNTYIGTWYCRDRNKYVFVYPCHVGETANEYTTNHEMKDYRGFDWCVDNGYLVTHNESHNGYSSISCYLSSDGGKTMELITGENSMIFAKIE